MQDCLKAEYERLGIDPEDSKTGSAAILAASPVGVATASPA
jgi:hypothetical protein